MDKHRLQSWWDFTIHQSLHQTTFGKWALELKSKSAFGWHDSHISPGRLLVRISPEIAQKRSVFARQHFYDFFGFKNNWIQRVPHPLSINPSTTKAQFNVSNVWMLPPKKAFRHQRYPRFWNKESPENHGDLDSVLGVSMLNFQEDDPTWFHVRWTSYWAIGHSWLPALPFRSLATCGHHESCIRLQGAPGVTIAMAIG